MKAVEIQHAQAGSVTSRSDGSVKISFVTPKLRPSEAGALILMHGKNVRLAIVPEDVAPEETVSIDTERGEKTPSQRLRGALFAPWQSKGLNEATFPAFYAQSMYRMIEDVKSKIP